MRVAAVEEVAAVRGALGADSGFGLFDEREELVGVGCHCWGFFFAGMGSLYMFIGILLGLGSLWCGEKCGYAFRRIWLQDMHDLYVCRAMVGG